MKLPDSGRREFLQGVAGWGLVWTTGSLLAPALPEAQNPPPPEPPGTTWRATIAPAGELGEPLVVEGRVFAPDGEDTVAGVTVYAYNTDQDGYYSPDGKVGHPRLKGYMKTDAEGRFELSTIRPGRYPGMHIPAHVHFNCGEQGIPSNGRKSCGSKAIRI
jgi:protocatechuate 3,4-dioxygenase beta subunit